MRDTQAPVPSPVPPDPALEPDPNVAPLRPPSPEAQRALAEAAARRAEADAQAAPPPEVNGRKGPEPVRFGDWEVKGIAIDF